MRKTEDPEAYLRSISEMKSDRKFSTRLMCAIASMNQYGRPIPQSLWEALRARCEPKRYKRFHRRMTEHRRSARIRAAASAQPVRLLVTRTVQYVYNRTDDERLKAFYSSPEWRAIRYEALRLHGGRCQCCGASPADGIRLNVDHIHAIRVFWEMRLDIRNLQVLCEDCNQGKGARHADDWRFEQPVS